MAILSLSNVSKRFGPLVVADAVSLDLAPGEALGVIGPNGAGKSTLFNLVTGNLRADSGSITLAGRDVTSMPARQRCRAGIGRTFQIPQPFVGLTVFENLLVAATFGAGRTEAGAVGTCGVILDETGLSARANQPAGGLSLLDRKRLELARALATDPSLLLLDEIAGGLTEAEGHVLVETIRRVHARGVAIVWIEHVLQALNAVVSRLIVLSAGKVIGEGRPADVMASREVREIYLGIEA